MYENNFCKPPPENLRGTTRIQVLVVQVMRMSHSVFICEIREIRGQKTLSRSSPRLEIQANAEWCVGSG